MGNLFFLTWNFQSHVLQLKWLDWMTLNHICAQGSLNVNVNDWPTVYNLGIGQSETCQKF